VILIDTGPLIALFDPKDPDHKVLDKITEPLFTTTEAVLAKVFHLLDPRGLKQLYCKNIRLLSAVIGMLP